jgi:dolichol-phosphate mannosyltransferase
MLSSAHATVELSVVVPCFNEASNIKALHSALTQACEAAVGTHEIVLINDGSRDGTWTEMLALAEADSRVIAVDMSRNFGHQLALSAGLSVCRGARILTIDADLQDPPDLLPQMMQLMTEGAHVVYGRRISRAGESGFKRISASIFYRLLGKLSDVPIPVDAGDFRLMRREVLNVLLAMPEQHRFVRGMVAWSGFRQVELPYERRPRVAGKTNYNLTRMVRLAIDAITGFSISPLRVSLALSGFCFLLAGGVLAYALYSYLFLDVVSGWTSLTVLISFFSAVQLFCLGVIGEYIGRIFVESKRRPLFVIREIKVKGHVRADEQPDDTWPATSASRTLGGGT